MLLLLLYDLAVYVKEGHTFAPDLSLENSEDSYLCFRLALLHSVTYFFYLYQSPSNSSFNNVEILSIIHKVLLHEVLLMHLSLQSLTSIIRTG